MMENGRRRERRVATKDQKTSSDDDALAAAEKDSQRKRQNQQLVLYLLVCCAVVLAWLLGTWQLSFFWVFCLVILIFITWKGKVLSLTEQYIKEKEILIHRRRALRQNETAEWLNFVINRWWVFSASTISDIVKKKIDPLLLDIMPHYLENLELESLSLGDRTPLIKFIQVYECTDEIGGGKRPLSLSAIMQPPPGLQQAHQFQLVLQVDVALQCDDFLMIFRAQMAQHWLGTLDVAVEKLYVCGPLQIIVRMDMDAPFPHVSTATFSFLEKPDVSFSVRILKAIMLTEIPLLKNWIYNLVMNGLCEALVDPGKLDFTTTSTGPTKVLSKPQPKSLAIGVLTFTINGKFQKSQEKGKKEKDKVIPVPELMDAMSSCVVRSGNQESCMNMISRLEPWTHTDSFLFYNFKTDQLAIDVQNQILLSTLSLAKFEMPLSRLMFDKNQRCTLPLSKHIDENEILMLGLSLEYTLLSNVEKEIEQGTLVAGTRESVAGVLYICLHSATNVLGLDPNGFSDPYCVMYVGGKKIKCTHYVPRTRNPKWDVTAEVIVKDISKSVLSFVVYDWDGRSTSEDDFLGSAHVLLTPEKPVLIRKSLNLGCNVMTPDSTDDGSLGTICITAVFTSVTSISPQSGTMSHPHSPLRLSSDSAINANNKPGKVRKPSAAAPVMMGGTVEIQIKEAKNLVAMDRNGFSDPFCEVKLGRKKPYVTKVKKKTLNPVWDEAVTFEIPKQDEKLEIVVWDWDFPFQKDFLGSLSFSLQDLIKYSNDSKHDGWFTLERINAGAIHLRITVNMSGDPQMTLPNEEANSISPKANQNQEDVFIKPESSASKKEEQIAGNSSLSTDSSAIHVDELQNNLTQSSASQQLTREYPNTLPRVRKAESENAINGDKKDQSGKSFAGLSVPSPLGLYYFGVRGHILSLNGLQQSVSHAYIKVRLSDPSSGDQKKPSAWHIVSKSTNFSAIPTVKLDVRFDVAHGHEVHRNSQIKFDVKSGRNNNVATGSFTLAEIFKGEDKERTQWLNLDNGVKIQVTMSYERIEELPNRLSNTHRSNSFLDSFRSSSTLKRIKEQ